MSMTHAEERPAPKQANTDSCVMVMVMVVDMVMVMAIM